jgi:hypothetical protein
MTRLKQSVIWVCKQNAPTKKVFRLLTIKVLSVLFCFGQSLFYFGDLD